MTEKTDRSSKESWLEATLSKGMQVSVAGLLSGLLVALAIATRFYDLETRVMSHDESLHTQFSLYLTRGNFEHTPLMHGPLQFHLVGLAYFLFGVSDAVARVPAAFFGVLTVLLVYFFYRWMGKTAALIGMGLMLISPYMLYYGRYVRNESLVAAFTLMIVYSMARYFETRRPGWLYLFAFPLMLHSTAKETSFIQAAQLMLFMAAYLAWSLLKEHWHDPRLKLIFLGALAVILVGAGMGLGGYFYESGAGTRLLSETAEPLIPEAAEGLASRSLSPWVGAGGLLLVIGLLAASVSLLLAFGRRLRSLSPALDVLVVLITMTLPQLGAIPASLMGWDPLDYQDPVLRLRTGAVVLALILVSMMVGYLWNWQRWVVVAGLFYGPYLLLYTTMFTNPNGVGTGLVGSLGYWLVQHGVERGGQPWYYYLFLQIPMYEFLPAVGVLIAVWLWLTGRLPGSTSWQAARAVEPLAPRVPQPQSELDASVHQHGEGRPFPLVELLTFLSLTSLAAYSFAGEKMPWLTVHITLPMILMAGWGIGALVRSIDWRAWWQERGWVALLLLILAYLALLWTLGYALGETPPFQGSQLEQLRVTTGFLVSLMVFILALVALLSLARSILLADLGRSGLLSIVVLLGTLTLRASFRAAYVNYDNATEFLVYAHSATGVKTVMKQVEDFSRRTTDGLAVDLGYDADVAWPMTWYLRDYSNAHYYGSDPSRELLNYPLVIAGDDSWSKVENLLGNRYRKLDYIRMWWPMQDYFNLTRQKLWNALTSPPMRAALFDIWLDRDYSAYGRVTGKDFSLQRWQPADRMRLYVRNDVAAMLWDYGFGPSSAEAPGYVDPYAEGFQELTADLVLAQAAGDTRGFQRPRDVAIGLDGSIYLADTGNSRIVHMTPEGELIGVWDIFTAAGSQGSASDAFKEPWGIAVGPDGSVYVADTWNHRVLKFSPQGEALGSFGYYGTGESLWSLWGPRDVAVDLQGRVYLSDTGNKRVVVIDEGNQPLWQIGGPGYLAGELDEPVGLALDGEGRLYVADTWNQRIQSFAEINAQQFVPVNEWSIEGWYGQGVESKPYLAWSTSGLLCASDPEGYRVLCFNSNGDFIVGWGDYGTAANRFSVPNGLAFDQEGALWVVDSGNNRLMRFKLAVP